MSIEQAGKCKAEKSECHLSKMCQLTALGTENDTFVLSAIAIDVIDIHSS